MRTFNTILVTLLVVLTCVLSGCRVRTPNEEIRQRAREVALQPISGEVFFETGKATILPGGLYDLEAIARGVYVEEEVLIVTGYASSPADGLFNQGLSLARANAVCDELSKLGVPRECLVLRGYGEDLLRHPDTAEARHLDQMVRVQRVSREVLNRAGYPAFVVQ